MTILLQGAGIQAVVSTPPDPIGDTLRADAVAYWKMDESSGARIDSVSSLSLTEYLTIPSVSGKIGAAIQLSDSTEDVPGLYNDAFPEIDLNNGFTITWWVKPYSFDVSTYISLFEFKHDAGGEVVYIIVRDSLTTSDIIIREGNGVVGCAPLSLNDWHFVTYWREAGSAGSVHIQIDGGSSVSDSVPISNGTLINRILIGLDANYLSDTAHVDVDEIAIFNRVLITGEIDYLYNSGAGRALFP